MDRNKLYADYVSHGRIPTTFEGIALLVDAFVVRSTPVAPDVMAAMNDAFKERAGLIGTVRVEQYFDRVRVIASPTGEEAPPDE
ncbi:MAG TPA: hypothetical protein VFM05_12900 [Candidatus Saccharimonadales bacterium]|nr:hypothetical protein [Candidatus Saccharimonadales bacterium]